MAATIRSLPVATRPSEVWRGAAHVLLRLNPKECEALALLFEEESVSDETRTLVLDLLAGAGTFEAQVVIRRCLALAVARRSNRMFATFVQRLGFVECPDGPTLRFLMSVYAESRNEPHDVRAACSYALGAAAGQAFAAGDPDAAVRASDVIRRDLLSAGLVIEKCALLTALGNAGVPSDVVLISRFTLDADGPVRAAAALALRKMTVPEACTHLVSMLADREIRVAQSALLALADQKLGDEELERLAELILAGRTSPAIDARVLRLLVAQKPRLTSCPGRAGAIENAIRLLLGRVEAAVAEPTGSGERRAQFVAPIGFPVMSQSGSVRAMPAARMQSSAPPPAMAVAPVIPAPPVRGGRVHLKSNLPTAIGVGLQQPIPQPQRQQQRPARPLQKTLMQPHSAPVQAVHAVPSVQVGPMQRSGSAPPNAVAPTVVDQGPIVPSGAYRIVNPGDSLETVRARMLEMGLDPDGRSSMIPQPPPRRATGQAPAAAPQTALLQPVQPNAIVRRAR